MPALRYRNVPAASEWLITVLGFAPHRVATAGDGTVLFAQLAFGDDIIMLSPQAGSDALREDVAVGAATEVQSCYFVVGDADAHWRKAKAAGAEIVADIGPYEHGGLVYSCRDPEGRVWNFGTYDPWQAPGTRRDRPLARALGRSLMAATLLTVLATATIAAIFGVPQQRAAGGDGPSRSEEAVGTRGNATAELARQQAAELASAESARLAAERSVEELRARLAGAETARARAVRHWQDSVRRLTAALEEARRENAADRQTIGELRQQLAREGDGNRTTRSGAGAERPLAEEREAGQAAATAVGAAQRASTSAEHAENRNAAAAERPLAEERESGATAAAEGAAQRASRSADPDPAAGAVVGRDGEVKEDADRRAPSARDVPDPEGGAAAKLPQHGSGRLAERLTARERVRRAARARARCRALFPYSSCE